MSSTLADATKSGRASAKCINTLPPRLWPTKCARGTPRAANTAATSAARLASGMAPSTCGLRPWLRRSTAYTRRPVRSAGCVASGRKLAPLPSSP